MVKCLAHNKNNEGSIPSRLKVLVAEWVDALSLELNFLKVQVLSKTFNFEGVV